MATDTIGINAKGERLTLSRQQEYQITRIMEDLITREGKFIRYKPEHSDATVAAAVQAIAPVKETHIAVLRRQVFGELARNVKGHSPIAVMHNRISDLLRRVEALEALVTKPTNRNGAAE